MNSRLSFSLQAHANVRKTFLANIIKVKSISQHFCFFSLRIRVPRFIFPQKRTRRRRDASNPPQIKVTVLLYLCPLFLRPLALSTISHIRFPRARDAKNIGQQKMPGASPTPSHFLTAHTVCWPRSGRDTAFRSIDMTTTKPGR